MNEAIIPVGECADIIDTIEVDAGDAIFNVKFDVTVKFVSSSGKVKIIEDTFEISEIVMYYGNSKEGSVVELTDGNVREFTKEILEKLKSSESFENDAAQKIMDAYDAARCGW